MERLTTDGAWQDFYKYIKQPDQWSALTKAARADIRSAHFVASGKMKRGDVVVRLGFDRLRRILEAYAPGRYKFQVEESVYLND